MSRRNVLPIPPNWQTINALVKEALRVAEIESQRGHQLMLAVTEFLEAFDKPHRKIALPIDVEKLGEALIKYNESKEK